MPPPSSPGLRPGSVRRALFLSSPGLRPGSIRRAPFVSSPGLRPGSVNPPSPRNTIRVAGELAGNVRDHAIEVPLVQRGGIEASCPVHGARNAAIGSRCGDALNRPNEVAEPTVGSKGHDQV